MMRKIVNVGLLWYILCRVTIYFCLHVLLVLPFRLCLCSESRHTDLLILAAEQAMEHSPLVLDSFPNAQLLALVDHFLRRLDGDLAVSSNLLCCGNSSIDGRFRGVEHLCNQSPLASLLRRNVVASQDRLHGSRLADGLGKAL